MGYNAKNYTEQGGDVTRIGGKLIIEEGGSVEGLPESANVPVSKADTVAKLKDDFNALLTVLKDAGYVAKDQFALGSNLIPSPAEEALAANHAKVASVSYENGEITVAADVDELTAFPSSEPSHRSWASSTTATTRSPRATPTRRNPSGAPRDPSSSTSGQRKPP